MSHRPLIPGLLFFIAGILIGWTGLRQFQPLILPLSLLISIFLILSLFIRSPFRLHCYLIVFLFAGILLSLSAGIDSDLWPLARERKRFILEGTVLRPVKVTGEIARIELKAGRIFVNDASRPLRENILVNIYSHAPEFKAGQRIRFPATLRPFKNFNNPGRYDYELAMSLRRLTCAASVSDGRYIVPMGRGHLGLPLEMMEYLRRPVRDQFRERLSPVNRALFSALILGERQEIDSGLREPFNIAGLGHILAVSGLHVGLVAWLSFFLFRHLLSLSYRLTLKTDIRRIAALMTCFPVVAYTFLSGFQISGQRAMIMVLAYLFSILLGREKETWSTLALAVFIVLALDPGALFSISFQLSFLAVIGILWLAPAIYDRIPKAPVAPEGTKILTHVSQYVTGLILVTFSAVIFLLPVTTFYFHRVSVVSIPANLTAVPLLGVWILPFGLLSSAILHISPPLANILIGISAYGLDWMMNIIRFWAGLSWASFWVVTPNLFEILLFYCMIFCLFFIRRLPWARIGLLLIILLWSVDISFWIYETRFNNNLRVTFLDVGQGNAALIQFPGKKRLLLDGGGFAGGEFDVGKMVLAPFLFHSKILHIDYLVLSHPQSDHMNGLRFIASHFGPEEFWYNGQTVETGTFRELMKVIKSKNTRVLLPPDLSGARHISGVKIELLHPPPGKGNPGLFPDTVDLNNNSLVIRFSFQGKSFLFPGDIEAAGEKEVVSNSGPALKSDVLLSPHHGSKSSSTYPFLGAVRPEICVISSGSGNFFGFPHRNTLEKLRDLGCEIIRIDKSGAVRISAGRGPLDVKTFLNGGT